MRRSSQLSYALLTLFCILALSVGCSPKKKTEEGAPESGSGSSAPITEEVIANDQATSDNGRLNGIETVYFDYDSSTLNESNKNILKNNARIIKENSSYRIQVEGHTDERGGIQYNIALGERRANSVKAFLVDQGVPSEHLTIISYGKEKPIDPGHDEGAWSKNRRANFRLTEK